MLLPRILLFFEKVVRLDRIANSNAVHFGAHRKLPLDRERETHEYLLSFSNCVFRKFDIESADQLIVLRLVVIPLKNANIKLIQIVSQHEFRLVHWVPIASLNDRLLDQYLIAILVLRQALNADV